jgi:hypothetical protein
MENSSVGLPTTEEVKGPAVATTSILAEEFRRAGDARRQEGGGLDKRVRALGRGRGRGRGRDGGLTDVEGVLLHGLVHVSRGVAAWRRRGRLVRREEGTETGWANLTGTTVVGIWHSGSAVYYTHSVTIYDLFGSKIFLKF